MRQELTRQKVRTLRPLMELACEWLNRTEVPKDWDAELEALSRRAKESLGEVKVHYSRLILRTGPTPQVAQLSRARIRQWLDDTGISASISDYTWRKEREWRQRLECVVLFIRGSVFAENRGRLGKEAAARVKVALEALEEAIAKQLAPETRGEAGERRPSPVELAIWDISETLVLALVTSSKLSLGLEWLPACRSCLAEARKNPPNLHAVTMCLAFAFWCHRQHEMSARLSPWCIRLCRACGKFFAAQRAKANSCSGRCRKRLQREGIAEPTERPSRKRKVRRH